jgi:hypothetical protein
MIPNLRTMQPPRVPQTTRRRNRARGLAVVTAASFAILASGQVACAYGVPASIGPVTVSDQGSTGEGIIETQIDPEGHEAVWEISLNCPSQPRCEHAEGQLPADEETYTASLELRGLEPGVAYRFAIETSGPGGEALRTGEFTVQPIPPGAAPEGQKEKEHYVPPELPWANQSGNEAAARTVAEQREKEREEENAKEAASRAVEEAQALKRREDEAAAVAAAPRAAVYPKTSTACIVPAVKGDTLAAARRALTRAHCSLGVVHRPAHRDGTPRVRRQSARAGTRLANDARVALWIEARSDTR